MMIQTNPFFVLNVGCTANRRESAIAAEEMDFVAGTEACAEAQRALTNGLLLRLTGFRKPRLK